MLTVRNAVCGIVFGMLATAWVTTTMAQEVKHYRFAYDQPKTTGYGIAGDLFANKLKELSSGSMLIDQYPGAQLGQERIQSSRRTDARIGHGGDTEASRNGEAGAHEFTQPRCFAANHRQQGAVQPAQGHHKRVRADGLVTRLLLGFVVAHRVHALCSSCCSPRFDVVHVEGA